MQVFYGCEMGKRFITPLAEAVQKPKVAEVSSSFEVRM